MIYTCTLNPSLDYYLEFEDEIEVGHVNRSTLEYYEAGGKGVNVSIVLNNMQIPSRAIGFIGGFTRDFYITLLQKYQYIQPSFTYIEGITRINVKCKGKFETDLNTAGPVIAHSEMESLYKKVNRLDNNDVLVFSGNCPESCVEVVMDMIKECANNGVRIVLDTNPSIVKNCLEFKPFLIKPNKAELEEISGKKLYSEDEIISEASRCFDAGAENVIVSLGENGSIMVNKDGVYKSGVVSNETVVNTVGAGDSMVAGFVMNSLRSTDVVDSFKYANSCGCATSYSKGLASREKIDEIYNELTIEKIR